MKSRVLQFITCFVLVGVLMIGAANAEEDNNDIKSVAAFNLQEMTIEELLLLQDEIQRVLADKGYVQYEELDRGSKGDAVINVQTRMKELGFYTGSITGKYDTETQKAFKLFEKANSLPSDGKAAQSDLVFLFSSAAIPKVTPTPAAETVEQTTKKPDTELDGYLPFSEFDYTEYFRYPEKYYGTKIVLKGKVVQVLGSRKLGYQIRLATSSGSDVVYVRINQDPGFNILEDDRVTVYATMKNTYTYTSTFFTSVTIPSADADRIKLN